MSTLEGNEETTAPEATEPTAPAVETPAEATDAKTE